MRDQLPHRYDHAWLLGQIVDGYYRTEMSTAQRTPTTSARSTCASRPTAPAPRTASPATATSSGEERAHRRRADRAAYLRDKLAEAERSERSA